MDILGFILTVVKSVATLVILLVGIAYILLADRKIWAAVQMRRGPNVVGPFGLFQSFADLIKFVLKEPIIPAGANKGVFLLAPFVMGMLALSAWAIIPVAHGWAVADINVGTLYIFAISSLSIYGVIMGGWASNSKYPFLSALRSAAQMVSYEVSIGFVIVTVLLCAGSLNLTKIVEAQDTAWGLLGWYWLPLFPMFVIFFVSALAETNRPPFDLVEAESELVAGFMVEYSSSPYMLFMLGRVRGDHDDGGAAGDPVHGRLAFADPLPAVHLDPRRHLVPAQDSPRLLHVLDGEGLRAALPLRPAHASRLEGVPAAVARNGGHRRCRVRVHRLGRGDGAMIQRRKMRLRKDIA